MTVQAGTGQTEIFSETGTFQFIDNTKSVYNLLIHGSRYESTQPELFHRNLTESESVLDGI